MTCFSILFEGFTLLVCVDCYQTGAIEAALEKMESCALNKNPYKEKKSYKACWNEKK